ncbi:MAG: PAS domain S-box protein [Desulfobulbus oligotrophicus]|jgi:PAS domain S-box-containing protein|nr:PAS domain S-box protein [Desulfobulbus oligotrophicus]
MDRQLQQLIEASPDAVLVTDRKGTILYWNTGAERIFGYPAAEAVGQSLDLIIPENLRARHWDGYYRVMATGRTKYTTDLLTSPGMHKDGSRISLEFSIVLLRDENGEIDGCASVMRDVTARWNKEKTLKKQLADCRSQLT